MGLQIESLINRGPVGTIRRAARTFADIIEPHMILQEMPGRDGIYPQELRAVIPMWQTPSISGRRKVLDMLRTISPEDYQRFNEDNLDIALLELQVNYLADEQMGGFRDCGTQGYRQFPPLIYATENAVGIVKHLTDIEDDQPLGHVNAVNIFGEEDTAKIIEFVRQSQEQPLGGFHHTPESVTLQPKLHGRASIWNTQRAMSILWNLEQTDYDGIDSVRNFLLACLVTGSTGEIGFRESMVDSPNPSSEATTAAVNVLEMMGEKSWIQEYSSGLVTFLKSCFRVNKKGLGGFGHIPGDEPTLLYTNAVLSSLDTLGVDVDNLLPNAESRQQLIQLYIKHCQSREQDKLLFGFAPGWAPNSHIMRETMYTLKQLAGKHKDFQGLWNTIYGDTEKVVRGIYEFPVELTRELAVEIGLA